MSLTQDVNYHRSMMTVAAATHHNLQITDNSATILMTDNQDEEMNDNLSDNINGNSISLEVASSLPKQKSVPTTVVQSTILQGSSLISTSSSPLSKTQDSSSLIQPSSSFSDDSQRMLESSVEDGTCTIENSKEQKVQKSSHVDREQNLLVKKSIVESSSLSSNAYNIKELTSTQKKSSSSSLSSATSSASSSSSAIDCPNSSMDDDQGQLIQDDSGKPITRRQWYHLWLPSYKSRLNQFQKQFTDKISSREKLIDDFVCAIQRELLLQGRMYVSLNYISFYSNIFRYETIINISYQDIESISKASTVRLFPNAIQIITNSGLKYFFTSFVSRERAFRLITRLWQMARHEQLMSWPEIRNLIRESYTTNGLGVDLSDIDDADAEIDLSKKSKKKKHSKRKASGDNSFDTSNINSSSDGLTNMDDIEDVDSPMMMSSSNHHIQTQLESSTTSTHNADVQTDDCDFNHSDHQCSLIEVVKQLTMGLRRKLIQLAPTQSQVIRLLFFVAMVLFLIQIGIYLRFQALNQRLLQTQQLLIKAIEQQLQMTNKQSSFIGNITGSYDTIMSSISASSDSGGGGSSYCYLNSGSC